MNVHARSRKAGVLGWCSILITMLLAFWRPALSQVTPGGFGNGDPATIPAFRQALAENRPLFRLKVPEVAGGMPGLIRTLVSSDVRTEGEPQSETAAKSLRRAILAALDHPSESPSRLYFVRTAFAFAGRGPPIVVLVCELCGTATLAMRAIGEEAPMLSPQLDLKSLRLNHQ
jgi:hypothetical protein